MWRILDSPLLTTPILWWWKRLDFKVINHMLLQVLQDTLELPKMSFFWLANKGSIIYKLRICYFYQQTRLQVKKGKRGRNKEIHLYNSLQSVFSLCILPASFTELNGQELISLKCHLTHSVISNRLT